MPLCANNKIVADRFHLNRTGPRTKSSGAYSATDIIAAQARASNMVDKGTQTALQRFVDQHPHMDGVLITTADCWPRNAVEASIWVTIKHVSSSASSRAIAKSISIEEASRSHQDAIEEETRKSLSTTTRQLCGHMRRIDRTVQSHINQYE
jgi:hypothetical protein